MDAKQLTGDLSISAQIDLADIGSIKAAGFRSVLSARRDGESEGQSTFDEIATAAEEHGLQTAHVPVDPANITDDDVAAFARSMADLPEPVLAFCGSGARVTKLWALSQAGKRPVDEIVSKASNVGQDLSAIRDRLRQIG